MLEEFENLEIKNLIAEKPIEPRDHSNLMIVNRKTGEISHKKFFNIVDYLNKGDCLVLNKSKVWKAKIIAKKTTGALTNLMLISPVDGSRKIWNLLSRKSKIGDEYNLQASITAKCIGKNKDGSFVFEFSSPLTHEYLEKFANVPIPSYIEKKRKEKGLDENICEDESYYQTVYAEDLGSIAAPTAGFHFTKELLDKISQKGVIIVYITLHVGWGTFKPVRGSPHKHKMLPEKCEINQQTADILNNVKSKKTAKIAAVGTSSVRTLEKMSEGEKIKSGIDNADIFIYPGYKFKIPDIFITNFHIPNSPPLYMTAAFCGKELLYRAYREAVDKKYRFYSYGDSMMII